MNKIFDLYWTSSKTPERVAGNSELDALKQAGYGHGAMKVYDGAKEVPTTSLVQISKDLGLELSETLLMISGIMGRPKLGQGLFFQRASAEPTDWVMTSEDAQIFMTRVKEHQAQAKS